MQIANPVEEEKLKRVIVRIRDLELASSITDLGGGGLSSALGETAKRYGCGAVAELDAVPLKYEDLAPWEIYVSESQERMLLTVPPDNLGRVLAIFREEDVEATDIGKLTSDEVLRLNYRGVTVADVEIAILFQPPRTTKDARYKAEKLSEPEPDFAEPGNLTDTVMSILSSPNVASKENVIRTYDHEVKGNTTLKPLQNRFAGPNDAAIVKPLDHSWKGIVLSCGINPSFGKIDPYWMAASAIDEAIRNNVAVGGRRVALLDNFTWGNPDKPERLGSLVKACEACYETARAFGVPFVSGKDSLFNESPLGPVTPTLLISALGIIPDIKLATSVDVKQAGDSIFIVGETFKELGGSEYYRHLHQVGGSVPKVRFASAKEAFTSITSAIDGGQIEACHDLSEGGLGIAAAEMAFAGGLGIELDLRKIPREPSLRDDFALFSESNSRFLLEVQAESKQAFVSARNGKKCSEIGKVTETSRFLVRGLNGEIIVNVELDRLLRAWKMTFRGVA